MNSAPLNPCLILDTNGCVSGLNGDNEKRLWVIYEEDFDLSIETLPLCVRLGKGSGLDEKM